MIILIVIDNQWNMCSYHGEILTSVWYYYFLVKLNVLSGKKYFTKLKVPMN